jgi:hypothetical protein
MAQSDERPIPRGGRGRDSTGERAEQVASWYFRLNGFLSIPGFVVHPDVPRRYPETEADLLAVRFPYSEELLDGVPMDDDNRLTALARAPKPLFLIVEVKRQACNVNGPWSNPERGNMQRVIRRLGFAPRQEVEVIAAEFYKTMHIETDGQVLQYVAVGSQRNADLQRQYPRLLQITWRDVGQFLYRRFEAFPQKLPPTGYAVHDQWPDFGKRYGSWFQKWGRKESQVELPFRGVEETEQARLIRLRALEEPVLNYIERGICHDVRDRKQPIRGERDA